MPDKSHRTSVGILGGGQLARMLAEAAHRLGLRPVVLAESKDAPAAQVAPAFVQGALVDAHALAALFSRVELVVFENEFVDCELLDRVARSVPRPPRFVPSLSAIAELQDKLRQKRRLEKLGIASAPFEQAPESGSEIGSEQAAWARAMLSRWPEGAVFKWARLGYDGKGVLIEAAVKGKKAETAVRRVLEFLARARALGVPVFAERKVLFRRELACVASLSIRGGELAAYPLVVSEQERGICRLVRGPARALGVPARLERQAAAAATRLARALPLHGTFAIEFFEDRRGKLWVNEIAPRVHNTGHYTQDAVATSQFENHWRAALGLKLGSTESAPAFAMLNLLGPSSATGATLEDSGALPEPGPRTHLHWYGKQGLAPGRKLGHLNGRAQAPRELGALVKELENCRRQWESRLRSPKKP